MTAEEARGGCLLGGGGMLLPGTEACWVPGEGLESGGEKERGGSWWDWVCAIVTENPEGLRRTASECSYCPPVS